MKKLIIALALLAGFSLSAQHQGHGKEKRQHHRMERAQLSPEQHATLRSKEMTLALDLSEAQQEKIYQLELDRAVKRNERKAREGKKEALDQEQKYERRSQMLDEQIAYRKTLKDILNKEQMAAWEKMRHKGRKALYKRKKLGDEKEH